MAISQTVQTIAQQLKYAGVLQIRGLKLVAMDENTLRVNKGWKNIDIKYNGGSDLYDVTVHLTNRKTLDTKSKTTEGVYCDQLADLFADDTKKWYEPK